MYAITDSEEHEAQIAIRFAHERNVFAEDLDGFAASCYYMHSLDELYDILLFGPDTEDMNFWDITAAAWRDAILDAASALKNTTK